MKIKDIEIAEKYNAYMQQTNVEFNNSNYTNAIQYAIKSWDLIPTKKEDYEESYYVAKKLYRYYYSLNDLVNAEKWAKILLSCDLERFEEGEREFFYGKVNYDLGNLEVAKEYLTIANKKSKGRCFIGEDKKYKKSI